ncbi:hypothetical protein [Paraburkholderia ferrariae]|uniref:Phage integrase family protein n=1 Tax=Paraburkholderia ferrariae TaxID=386056 RepID=A0ABU9S205_9BURK
MSLFELQAWLGHRSPATTQHYVAITPTKLARAHSEAQYFQRNLRMMEVLIDRQAIDDRHTDQPWKYYDLGHGLYSYEFFDQCPHRMACVRRDFYVPKKSSQADLLSSKTGMIRMLQETPLTDDERAAIEGEQEAVDRLLRYLEGYRHPTGAPPQRVRNKGRKKRSIPYNLNDFLPLRAMTIGFSSSLQSCEFVSVMLSPCLQGRISHPFSQAGCEPHRTRHPSGSTTQ